VTVGIDYAPDTDWNIALRIPYVIRTHSTYGEYDAAAPLPPLKAAPAAAPSAVPTTALPTALLVAAWLVVAPPTC